MNFKYFIKQLRKSAIILKDEEAFKKYLEDHPNYREGTIFIVDGVERKAPPKKKKTTSYKEDELKTINGVFNGAFRALEGKGYKINELTPEQTEKFHNMLNGILEKNKIRPLSKEEFKEMFTSEINKRFPKKEEKKEVPHKQENPKQEENSREQTLEKIYNNPRTNAYVIGNMSRKDYFNYVNGSLKDSGNEELTEDEFKNYLREKVFDFKPSQNRSDQTSYTKKHFAKNVNWGNFSIEDVNTMNKTLTELVVDYPEMEETLDKISTNARFKSNIWAVYKEKPIGWFNDGIINSIEFNPKSQVFFENYVPFRHSDIKQKIAKSRGRDYRSNVGDDGENRQEAIARTVTHEVAHKLFAKRKRDDLGIGKKDGMVSWRKATLLEMDWEVLRKETKKSGEISKISNYAKTNLDEFFAECFTMYRFERENLPKNVLEKMEEFIKWCSMMK